MQAFRGHAMESEALTAGLATLSLCSSAAARARPQWLRMVVVQKASSADRSALVIYLGRDGSGGYESVRTCPILSPRPGHGAPSLINSFSSFFMQRPPTLASDPSAPHVVPPSTTGRCRHIAHRPTRAVAIAG